MTRYKLKKLKIILFLAILTLLIPFSVYGQKKVLSKRFELENGMKIYLLERKTLPLINLAIAVNFGSKDETEETNGLAHILEHYILFRGTEFRSGSEIGQDIRRHGAYFNAYTSHDLTLFEMNLPSEYADFALRNQREILFNLKLTQEELDREKKVILEELSQIHDDPRRYATSLAYQNLFNGHPYQKPIYGKKEVIEAATVEEIENLYRKYFVPANCALAIVGDFNIEEMENKVKEVFGPLESKAFFPSKFEKAQKLKKTVEIEKEMDVNQAYLVLGLIGPDVNHEDQYAVDLLTQILGHGIVPMLNYPLRGRRKLVQSVSMSYTPLKYGGVILIYLTCDRKSLKSAKSEAIKFLKTTRRQNYSKDDFMGDQRHDAFDYLECSQNQIKFAFQQSQERGRTVALALARFMLLNENQPEVKYLDQIEDINSMDLRKAAGKYLTSDKYVIVSISPKKK